MRCHPPRSCGHALGWQEEQVSSCAQPSLTPAHSTEGPHPDWGARGRMLPLGQAHLASNVECGHSMGGETEPGRGREGGGQDMSQGP